MPTLTVSELLKDFIVAFQAKLPVLDRFSITYKPTTVTKGQTVIGHLETIPAVTAYDAAQGGYFNGATEARSLLIDVPVTIDLHPKVTVKMSHLNAISDQKRQINIGNMAYSLKKYLLDQMLAKVLAANFTQSTTEAAADVDIVTLQTVRQALALKKADTANLVGIGNVPFMSKLKADTRIASRDYHGQQATDGNFVLTNVEGFAEIHEYVDMPTNSQNLSAFFADNRAIVGVTGLPTATDEMAAELGLSGGWKTEDMQAPGGGPAFRAFIERQQGTGDIFVSITCLAGFAAGAQAGSAGDICDYAGHRVKTA